MADPGWRVFLSHSGKDKDFVRKLYRRLARDGEPGHPSIAISQSNLAMVLQDLGQLEEARDLLRKAYRAYLGRFGPDHPGTQTVRQNLESLGN